MTSIHGPLKNDPLSLWERVGVRAGAAPKPRPHPRPLPEGEGVTRALLAAVVFAAALPAAAQDQATIDRTQIIGNRELPKVLYIVPWKKPVPGDLAGKPLTSVVDEALAPIDRDVFRRQVRYDAQVQPKPEAPTSVAR